MLGRLGLQLSGGTDVRHQRNVDIERISRPTVKTELAYSLQKRQRFDVSNRTADFDNRHVSALGIFDDLELYLIGDVRNYLDCSPKIIAATFLGNNGEINLAGRKIALSGKDSARKTFVMPQIKISFSTVKFFTYS